VLASQADVRAAEEFMRGKTMEQCVKHLLVNQYVLDRVSGRTTKCIRSKKSGTGTDAHWDWKGVAYHQNAIEGLQAWKINFEKANQDNPNVKKAPYGTRASRTPNGTASGV
jgi:hypothetical protein